VYFKQQGLFYFVLHVYAVNVVPLFAKYFKNGREYNTILIVNVNNFAQTHFYARLFKASKGKLLQILFNTTQLNTLFW